MEVILLERVGALGSLGDRVRVKNGYARNYLLPSGKALRATKANLERFEGERAHLEERMRTAREAAQAQAAALEGRRFTIIRQASEAGQLYGSVRGRDISALLAESGIEMGPRQVVLEKPIKTLGVHRAEIRLHPEVSVSINLSVARSQEEAGEEAEAGAGIEEMAQEMLEEEAARRFAEEAEQEGAAEAEPESAPAAAGAEEAQG